MVLRYCILVAFSVLWACKPSADQAHLAESPAVSPVKIEAYRISSSVVTEVELAGGRLRRFQPVKKLGEGSNGKAFLVAEVGDEALPMGHLVAEADLEVLKIPKDGHIAELLEEKLYLERMHHLQQKLKGLVEASPFTNGVLKKNSKPVLIKPFFKHLSLAEFFRQRPEEIGRVLAAIDQLTGQAVLDLFHFEQLSDGRFAFKPYMSFDFNPGNFIIVPSGKEGAYRIVTIDGATEALDPLDESYFGKLSFSGSMDPAEARRVLVALLDESRVQSLVDNYAALQTYSAATQWEGFLEAFGGKDVPLPIDEDSTLGLVRSLSESDCTLSPH